MGAFYLFYRLKNNIFPGGVNWELDQMRNILLLNSFLCKLILVRNGKCYGVLFGYPKCAHYIINFGQLAKDFFSTLSFSTSYGSICTLLPHQPCTITQLACWQQLLLALYILCFSTGKQCIFRLQQQFYNNLQQFIYPQILIYIFFSF